MFNTNEVNSKLEVKLLPKLYKKTNTGAIQYWSIFAQPKNVAGQQIGEIVTVYGQLGTDKPQRTIDIVDSGKNIGKKNETTAYEQACKEATSKWEKQLKKGYVDSAEKAENQEVDVEFVQGGVLPMLAHSFDKQSAKIKYPAAGQPKLDGTRMICIIQNGKATLWSRTRKQMNSLPHIISHLEEVFDGQTLILDGEAYNHDFKNNFEDLISLIRQDEPGEGHEKVQYHVYDLINDNPFSERNSELISLLSMCDFSIVQPVETVILENEEDVARYLEDCLLRGYEGSMLRNLDGKYVNKRSADLQKVKTFQDEEFDIIGIEEGSGKLKGHVGAFICETSDGAEFNVKMSGSLEKLKEYFDDHSLWEGKRITVKFQGFTNGNVPRFPVGKCIRNYE